MQIPYPVDDLSTMDVAHPRQQKTSSFLPPIPRPVGTTHRLCGSSAVEAGWEQAVAVGQILSQMFGACFNTARLRDFERAYPSATLTKGVASHV